MVAQAAHGGHSRADRKAGFALVLSAYVKRVDNEVTRHGNKGGGEESDQLSGATFTDPRG